MSKILPVYVPDISYTCPRYFLYMSKILHVHVQDIGPIYCLYMKNWDLRILPVQDILLCLSELSEFSDLACKLGMQIELSMSYIALHMFSVYLYDFLLCQITV